MKKIFITALIFVLVLFGFTFHKSAMSDMSPPGTAVHTEKADGTKVYSFSGSDEVIAVMNGTVIIGEGEEIFSGGTLKINSDDFFDGVTSYKTAFYILEGGTRKTLMSNHFIDQTGGNVILNGDDLGKISGVDVVTGYDSDSTEELMNNLFFEISTVDADGATKTHQLLMDVAEVN